MITMMIDSLSVQAEPGSSILQAALSAGIPVTHLCSDSLSGIEENCGLCLVEIEGRGRLVLACETPVAENMRVLTDTPKVRQAVMERAAVLFADHPADCAVCSKAGDCVVQKICAKYRPELAPKKKKQPNRKLLDWIECDDEKCIGCGRCAAFLKKLGVDDAASLPPSSCPPFPLSGTLVDLCPAGALTENVSDMKRVWEIKKVQSIDVTDCVGTKINLNVADGKIISAKPAERDGLISDKARFCLDGLSKNRIDRPYIRINGRLKECSWTEALTAVAEKMKAVPADKMAGLVGEYADCESMLALRDLFALKGANAIDARQDDMYFDTRCRQSWLFNTPFSCIGEADALLCVGADVDALAPALAWHLRQNPMPKAFIGKRPNSYLPYEVLSNNPLMLEDILNDLGRGASLLRQARKPMIIVGAPVMRRCDAAAIMRLICQISEDRGVIREDWNGYNFLIDKASVPGALELGLVPEEPLRPKIRRFDLVYLLNEDRFQRSDAPEAFVVYQGIYASDAAREADIVLPSLSFAEKKATYVNAEGRAQSTAVALPAFGQAREDWKILRALSEYLETAPLPYNDLDDIRDALAGKSVVFYSRGEIHQAENKEFGIAGELSDEPIDASCDSFADELSRQSDRAKMLRWRSR